MKTSSEKGWSNFQSYFNKGSGHKDSEEEDGKGEEDSDSDQSNDDATQQKDIGNLINLQNEEEEYRPKKQKEKRSTGHSRREVDDGPPLISFDDDEQAVVAPTAVEGSPRSKIKAKSYGTSYGSMGYGSTGTNSTKLQKESKVEEWSGNWGEEWTEGGVASSSKSNSNSIAKVKSGWEDDWNTEGWSTVNLQSKSD